jgi:hypothetical protein
MLTRKEAQQGLMRHRDLGTVFIKVWATARPGHEDFMDHRFPGLSRTGYFIESPLHVMAFQDWMDIERIEQW